MTSEEFIDLYQHTPFRHSETLMEGLESGTWELTSYTGAPQNRMSTERLISIYEKKCADPNPVIAEEFRHLIHGLKQGVLSDIVDICSFSNGEHFINVFIARESEDILATVKTNA